jgi:malonyl-CoA O-methyltransferase
MFNPKKEFSRFADDYKAKNIIQKDVARELLDHLKNDHSTILELGCGHGEIYSNYNLDYKSYKAVDISSKMCDLHPKGDKLVVDVADFDIDDIFCDKYDLIISSSALQWSKDIDTLMHKISQATSNIAFAIFTSNTFKSIHNIANISSPIYNKETLIEAITKYFDVEYYTKEYKLEFESNKDMFRYIKSSGVSGGTKRLSIADTKKLIREYPLSYLEFEVIYFISKEL